MKPTHAITINHLDVKIEPNIHNRLRWKEYQILNLLIQNSPAPVTRAELVNQIWKGTYCSDSTINQTIKSIRQKIGDENHNIIKTIPRIGYIIEDKHLINIILEPDPLSEMPQEDILESIADVPSPAYEPSQADLTDENKPSRDNGQPIRPLWVEAARAKTVKSVIHQPETRVQKVKKSFFSLTARVLQFKNKVLMSLMAFFVIFPALMYITAPLKTPFTSYATELAKFNKVNAVTLICPLGYSNASGDGFTCKSLKVNFEGVAFDCRALGEK